MAKGDFEAPKPRPFALIKNEPTEAAVERARLEHLHRRAADEQKQLREVLRPTFLNRFAEKYNFKNHPQIIAFSAAIRKAKAEECEHVYISADQEGVSAIEQLAIEVSKNIDAAPDDVSKTEALEVLEKFFAHPAFRSLNVAFKRDEKGVLLNWRT